MKKVTKNTIKAIIRINGFAEFYMVPCKSNKDDIIWFGNHMKYKIKSLEELEKIVNEFIDYNCNHVRGYYPNYYTE